jgi:hypothetical protein
VYASFDKLEEFISLVFWQNLQCFFLDFKRAGISRLLKEKGREQFWPKKDNLRRTMKNLKKWTEFHYF